MNYDELELFLQEHEPEEYFFLQVLQLEDELDELLSQPQVSLLFLQVLQVSLLFLQVLQVHSVLELSKQDSQSVELEDDEHEEDDELLQSRRKVSRLKSELTPLISFRLHHFTRGV